MLAGGDQTDGSINGHGVFLACAEAVWACGCVGGGGGC